ncbi:transformer-2 protein homolog alpha-like [Anopheles ziemanni]|uniref:transformer-2 protein homolog alpha-like n=1 Tax=Anopheles coustani TaxID=139045 RepID=UPI00265AD0DC|nr:transformer-2 protein homolog alpha-like [Anopheles coustani]XP_058177348.1 transformer-2 protein homolog alpha-like [Anopheles ziemanni]
MLQVLSHRHSSRRTSRRFDDGSRRSRSSERYHRHRRSRRSRSDSSDRYLYRSESISPDRRYSSRRDSSTYGGRIRVDGAKPSHCLGVFGLSVYTTEPHLVSIFSQYGIVEKAYVVYDAKTRISRGFGFVYFQTVEEASLARSYCNGMEYHGRRIRVDFSITDRPHPPTPGVYKGRVAESRSPSPREYSHRSRQRYH